MRKRKVQPCQLKCFIDKHWTEITETLYDLYKRDYKRMSILCKPKGFFKGFVERRVHCNYLHVRSLSGLKKSST